MTRRCETCQWWTTASIARGFGSCKAAPPSVDRGETVWPSTDADDWCGTWRISEALAGGRDRRVRA
jgi:hypothetical protein